MSAPILQYPVAVDGLITRVLECGSGEEVVVCLHGAGSRADRWRPVLPLLADAGLHAYALDFPGHGLAAKPAGYDYGTPAFTRVACDFLRWLDQPAVSLLGTSLGAHVAACVALALPHRVATTVLIGAVGLTPGSISVEPARSPIVDTSVDGIRAKLEFLVADPRLVTEEWVSEESRINSSPGASNALAELGRYMSQWLDDDVVGEQYAELGLPTLLCWGAQDRWIPPEVGEAASRLLPEAPLVLIEGTGHAPYFERPTAFAPIVTRFLAEPGTFAAGPVTV
jgi:2-hydroxy-6-oxonona-2,4-dienedioate hydrolase